MITARRFYIDEFMKDNNKLFQGKILDIGGYDLIFEEILSIIKFKK